MGTIRRCEKDIAHWVGRRYRRVFTPEQVSAIVADVRKLAKSGKNGRAMRLLHAGTVPNKYDYPAHTMCLFVAAYASGNALVVVADIPANKATLGGAAAALLGREARPRFDLRYGRERTALSSRFVWREVRRLVKKNFWID